MRSTAERPGGERDAEPVGGSGCDAAPGVSSRLPADPGAAAQEIVEREPDHPEQRAALGQGRGLQARREPDHGGEPASQRREQDLARTTMVRVLNNSVTRGLRGDPKSGSREAIGDEEGRTIYLFSTNSPLRSMTGDFEAMALYAGEGVGRLQSIVSAEERMRSIVDEATAILTAGSGPER